MKLIKTLGLICLICFTFFYTEKIIDISINQDEIMIELKEQQETINIPPTNAIISEDIIIPGKTGRNIDLENSYKEMKKLGYFEKSLVKYETIYPEISIYNHYNLYLEKGNPSFNSISLIYILKNDDTLNDLLSIINNKKTPINFFIDNTFLNNNINLLKEINNHEIYNYGNNGIYTKDNLIIGNNIINNKSKNNSNLCLNLEKNSVSLNNCSNLKMFSLTNPLTGSYNEIKKKLTSGNIILINNTKELPQIIDLIKSKGYSIIPLSKLINE